MPSKFLNLSTDTTLGGNVPSDELAVSQKAIKTYVDNHGGGGSVAIDNTTITENASQEIQAVAVIDQNTGIAKTWTGTQAEYDAIVTKDPETEYIITDDIGGSATEIGQITEDINDLKEHTVIEFQEPTSANGYTWYRKYADGWVEQGGCVPTVNDGVWTITLPVAMADAHYTSVITREYTNYSGTGTDIAYDAVWAKTSTNFKCWEKWTGSIALNWQVSGMAA